MTRLPLAQVEEHLHHVTGSNTQLACILRVHFNECHWDAVPHKAVVLVVVRSLPNFIGTATVDPVFVLGFLILAAALRFVLPLPFFGGSIP